MSDLNLDLKDAMAPPPAPAGIAYRYPFALRLVK